MKSRNNPLFKDLRGMLGGLLVFREVRGKTVISNRPKKREQPTAHQLKTKEKFLKGVAYAKGQMKNPAAKALYTAAITQKKFHAYMVALTDYLTPPVIHSIESGEYSGGIGQVIGIKVTDDFRVEGVQVRILNENGLTVEQGDGVLAPGSEELWQYVTMMEMKIRKGCKIVAAARDRPGNVVVMSYEL